MINSKELDMIKKAIMPMRSNTITNYVVSGLQSSLLTNGKVRLFEQTRNQIDFISPHSHRYDFTCLVLAGEVENTIWREVTYPDDGDLFQMAEMRHPEAPGQCVLNKEKASLGLFSPTRYQYCQGECYSMDHSQIHTIRFSAGAVVLFFEGPMVSNTSKVLEPVVDGEVLPLSTVREWMFKPLKAG